MPGALGNYISCFFIINIFKKKKVDVFKVTVDGKTKGSWLIYGIVFKSEQYVYLTG
jgi:hypothetical protein